MTASEWEAARSATSWCWASRRNIPSRSEEHTSELQSHSDLVCRLLLEYSPYNRELPSFPTRRSSDLNNSVNTGMHDDLTVDDMKAVQQEVPGIQAASPMLETHDRIGVGGGKERDILVLGVSPQYSIEIGRAHV